MEYVRCTLGMSDDRMYVGLLGMFDDGVLLGMSDDGVLLGMSDDGVLLLGMSEDGDRLGMSGADYHSDSHHSTVFPWSFIMVCLFFCVSD